MRAYSALNRREMPPTTPDWVNIDHRRGTSFEPGQLPALLTSWELAHVASSSVEVVHRLNNLGAVISSVSHETSQEGLEAEWRSICVITLDRDLIDRLEVFDEGDLDAALARFDQLSRPAPRLENAASQVDDRFLAHFAAGDWDAMAEILADDLSNRRSPSGGQPGIFDGRDALIANIAGDSPSCGSTNVTSDRHRDPRGAPCPRACYRSRGDQGRSLPYRGAHGPRDRRRRADFGDCRLRCRRHRGSLRRARCPLPRRRSGRSRAHMVGDLWQLRGDQPTRDAVDHAGLCQHRPPTGDRDGGRRPDRNISAPGRTGAKTTRLMSRPCIG